MRERKEIEGENHKLSCGDNTLVLEVLLDIRELLQKQLTLKYPHLTEGSFYAEQSTLEN